jgi:glycosyltransferase involved in cell wall biosynthesis
MSILHISLTELRNSSRVLKITKTVSKINDLQVYIAAYHGLGLNEIELNDYAEIKRFKLSTRNYGNSFLIKLIKYLEFSYRIIKYYRYKNIKIVSVHSVGLLPLGFLLKFIFKNKLIYDTHELETETEGDHGLRKKIIKLVEKIFIKFVDHTFVVGENISKWYDSVYKIKTTTIYNTPFYKELENSKLLHKFFSLRHDQIIVLYQGGLSAGRGLMSILNTFLNRDNDNVVVIFMGSGPLKEDIINAAKSSKNIFYHEAVSPGSLLKYTCSADIGIHMISNTCLNHLYCMPNKLFEYTMAGLALLVSNMKEMEEFVVANKNGAVLNSISCSEISNSIDDLIKNNIHELKMNSLIAAKKYNWDVQEPKILSIYNSLLEKNDYNN